MDRRQFLKIASAGGATLLAASPAEAVGLSPACVEPSHVTVNLSSAPPAFRGMKIAFLSDLHFGSIGVSAELMEKSIEMAMAGRPDIICFGGDLITGWGSAGSLGELLPILRTATAPLGVYGVMGNHEFLWGINNAMREFERSNIRILRNETMVLLRGNDRLPLIGIDNLFNQTYAVIQKQIQIIERFECSIVLEHTPDIAPFFSERFRGLLLCGHTHGGQIILPFLGQAVSASRFGLRYVSGLYPAGGGVMYVTRGIGAVLIPARIGCPPEVTILELAGTGTAET